MTAPDPGPARLETTTAHQAHSDSPERRLWAEALGQLIRDASAYWRGRGQPGNPTPVELEQAFDDICRAGPMTQRVCSALDIEPEEVSRQFIRHCEGL